MKNIPVSGTMLKAEVLKALLKLMKDDFMGSIGWLNDFMSQQIKMSNLHRERTEVLQEVTGWWKSAPQAL